MLKHVVEANLTACLAPYAAAGQAITSHAAAANT